MLPKLRGIHPHVMRGSLGRSKIQEFPNGRITGEAEGRLGDFSTAHFTATAYGCKIIPKIQNCRVAYPDASNLGPALLNL